MINIIFYTVFLFITAYILLKSIGYGLYEIKENKNKIGGICVISFSILVVIFANIMLWIY
ncbi:MAG: hypothetical protein HFJ55_07845 [Clostridia bacterium]|nr:hypothetical protein [Clostridia bacterium]MCI8273967.1 hypothetical protein [Clostridia bacterium]